MERWIDLKDKTTNIKFKKLTFIELTQIHTKKEIVASHPKNLEVYTINHALLTTTLRKIKLLSWPKFKMLNRK